MNKFGMAFLSLMMLCFAPMLVACNTNSEQIYRVKIVEFTEESIAMSVDSQPYQLEWEIEDNVALNQNVTLKSSRPEVATVSDTGLVTPVGTGVTVISISSEDNPKAKTNTCTVRILPNKQTLAQPQNLQYVADTHELTWDKVVENVSGGVISDTSTFVPKYEITLTTAQGTTTKVVSTNVYDELEAGVAYQISVKALGNIYLYDDSRSTPSINVHVLSSVENLHVTTDKQYASLADGQTLSQDSSAIAGRSFSLNFKVPQDGSTDISNYSILLLNSSLEEVTGETKNLFAERVSQASLENGVFNINLNGLPSGEYFVRVTSKGDAQNSTYDSAFVTTKRIKVLSAPTNLVLTGENKQTLTWDRVPYATAYQLLIEYKFSSLDQDAYYANFYIKSTQNTVFDLSGLTDKDGNKFVETQYSTFNIYLFALGNDDDASGIVVDSVRSEDTARAQLAQVQNLRLTTARSSSEPMTITWNKVTNAGTYSVEILHDGKSVATYNQTKNTLTIDQDASFLQNKSGKFEIYVTAMPSANQNYTKSIVSDKFEIEKLATPTLATTNGVITWDAITNVSYDLSYVITYNTPNAESKTVNISNRTTSYDFSANVYNSGQYTDFCIKACASSPTDKSATNFLFDSNTSTAYTVVKMSLPNQFTANSGVLALDTGDFNSFVLKVSNAQNVLTNTTVSASNFSTTLSSVVSRLSAGVEYTFSLVGLGSNLSPNNTLYVKSNARNTSVYVSQPVEAMGTQDGVITFKMPDSLYSFITRDGKISADLLTAVKYTVKCTNSNIGKIVAPDINSTLDQTTSVDFGSDIKAGETVNVGVQITFENATNPSVCILNSATTYHNYTKLSSIDSSTATVSENASGDWVLKWQKNGVSNLEYQFEIKHGSDTVNMVVEDTDGSITVDENNFNNLVLNIANKTSGTYNITAKIKPLGNNSDYLKSDVSNVIVFSKLVAPELNISNGKVNWNAVDTSSLISYELTVRSGEQINIINVDSGTSYDLSNYADITAGTLSVSIRAVSTKDMVLSSDYSGELNTVKLDSSHVEVEKVTEDSISWSFKNVTDFGDVSVLKFDYEVYNENNMSTSTAPLSSGTLTMDPDALDNWFTYTMPRNNNFVAGNYVLKIKPKAETAVCSDTTVDFIDGATQSLYIQKLEQVADLNISNKQVSWTPILQEDDVRYNIAISTLSGYSYIVNKSSDSEAQLNTDETNEGDGVFVYDVPTSGGKFVLNLLKSQYSSTVDDCGIIQNILRNKPNYVPEGTTFNLMLTSTIDSSGQTETDAVSYRTKTINTTSYYIFDSNRSSIQNITLLDAPLVVYNEGQITWTANKTNFERFEFTYKPYKINEGTELINNTDKADITKSYTSYSTRSFELSDLFADDDSADYYVLTVQSIGNDSKTISSNKSEFGFVFANIKPITVNYATSGTPNGWYIKDGEICWNSIEGAGAYVLRFEEFTTNNVITRSQQIRIQSTGAPTYTYLPGSEMHMKNQFYLSFRAIGTSKTNVFKINSQDYGCAYASSNYFEDDNLGDDVVGKLILHQLDTNNTAYIQNGELYWNHTENTIGYNLKFTYDEEGCRIVANDTSTLYYNLCDEISSPWDSNTYNFSIQCVGNTYLYYNDPDSNVDVAGIYLSSQFGNYFTFKYINSNDIKLDVIDGDFGWKISQDSVASDWKAIYQVGVKLSDEALEYTYLDSQTTLQNDLANYAGQNISAIIVKILGDENSAQVAGIPMVKSGASKALTNLLKLPNIKNYADRQEQIIINEIGDIVWNCGYDESLTALGLNTKVSVNVKNATTNAIDNSYTVSLGAVALNDVVSYNYEDNRIYGMTVFPNYEMSVFVVGTNYNEGGTTYLTSNKATKTAKKFGRVSNFVVKNEISLSWNMDSASIITAISGNTAEQQEPDKIMIEYISSDDFNTETNKPLTGKEFSILVFDSKLDNNFVTNLAQFLNNGTYFIKMSVFSTGCEYFRGTPVYCTILGTNNKAIEFGNVLGDLVYVNTVPYFTIQNETHLKNIQTTLDKNSLAISATTVDIEGTGRNYKICNVSRGANYMLTQDITLSSLTLEEDDEFGFVDNLHSNIVLNVAEEDYMTLYGVFDGNGKTISNIQTINSPRIGLFDQIYTTAIIKDLSLQYSNIVVEWLGCVYDGEKYVAPTTDANNYFGLVTKTNRGLIQNCKVYGGTTENANIFSEFTNTNNIIFGMIAGLNTSTDIIDSNGNVISTVRGQIINCSNGINTAYKQSNGTILMIQPQYEQYISVGGIVGVNDGSDIIDCTNGLDATYHGNLSGFMVGGIAYRSLNQSMIYGCVNNGNIDVYARVLNNVAIAGGIVAFDAFESNIAYCINRGNIRASALSTTMEYNSAQLGGIAGRVYGNDGEKISIVNCLQTYQDGSSTNGVYIIPHAAEEGGQSYWSGKSVGYLAGSVSTTLEIKNFVYKQSPVTDDDHYPSEIYPGDGGSESEDVAKQLSTFATNEAIADYLNTTSDILNNYTIKPRFVITESGTVGLVLKDEFDSLVLDDAESETWTTQTVALNEITDFVVKLKDGADFNLSTIKVAKILYDDGVNEATTALPTTAGTYTVWVCYGLTEIEDMDLSIFKRVAYTYIVTSTE